MKRISLIGALVLGFLLVYAGTSDAGGWMHRSSEGWTDKSENARPAQLRVENLPAFEEGDSRGIFATGPLEGSKSASLSVENLPVFEERGYWGPMETGTIQSSGSANQGRENLAVLEGGKYGGD